MDVQWVTTIEDVVTGALISGELPHLGHGYLALSLVVNDQDQDVLELHATVNGQVYQGCYVQACGHELHQHQSLVPAGLAYLRTMMEHTPRQPWWRRAWYQFQLFTACPYEVVQEHTDRLLAVGRKNNQWGLFIWSHGLSIFVPKKSASKLLEVWETPQLLEIQVSVAIMNAQNDKIAELFARLTDSMMQDALADTGFAPPAADQT